VVNGDGVVMQSAHSGRSSQLHKDISGNEAQLTSYAVLTRKPVSNIKQSMLNGMHDVAEYGCGRVVNNFKLNTLCSKKLSHLYFCNMFGFYCTILTVFCQTV